LEDCNDAEAPQLRISTLGGWVKWLDRISAPKQSRWQGIRRSLRKDPLFEEFRQPSVAPSRFACVYCGLAGLISNAKAAFSG
jgi:hypothetical protein